MNIDQMSLNKNLFSALSKAQGEIKGAKKTSDNPFFKSKFADLAEVIEVIQDPLSKNGLSVLFDFKTEIVESNPVGFIRYILSHSSGECFSSSWLCMFMKDKTPQGFGSSCTYYRRQLLKAIFQIQELDDDGNYSNNTQFVPQPKTITRKPYETK